MDKGPLTATIGFVTVPPMAILKRVCLFKNIGSWALIPESPRDSLFLVRWQQSAFKRMSISQKAFVALIKYAQVDVLMMLNKTEQKRNSTENHQAFPVSTLCHYHSSAAKPQALFLLSRTLLEFFDWRVKVLSQAAAMSVTMPQINDYRLERMVYGCQ